MLLDQITVDHTLNVRTAVDEETVERCRAIFDRLPPVVVYHLPGDGVYLLADGFHRVEAAHRLRASIRVKSPSRCWSTSSDFHPALAR